MKIDASLSWNPDSNPRLSDSAQWLCGSSLYHVANNPWRIVSPSGQVYPLDDTLYIDRCFSFGERFLLADWRKRRVWDFDPQKGEPQVLPFMNGLDIAAMQINPDGGFWVLVRSMAQILQLDEKGQLLQRLGKRLGISAAQRLGFEWPEDAHFSADASDCLVADSGNDRLLRIEMDSLEFKEMRLPITPRFILFDRPDGWLVSDGAADLVWGNDRRGPQVHLRDQPFFCVRKVVANEALFTRSESGQWGRLELSSEPFRNMEELGLARTIRQLEANDSSVSDSLSHLSLAEWDQLFSLWTGPAPWIAQLNDAKIFSSLCPDPWTHRDELLERAQALFERVLTEPPPLSAEKVRIERAVLGYQIKKRVYQIAQEVRDWNRLAEHVKRLDGESSAFQALHTALKNRALVSMTRATEELSRWRETMEIGSWLSALVDYTLSRKSMEELKMPTPKPGIPPFNRSIVGAIELYELVWAEHFLEAGELDRFNSSYQRALERHPNQYALSLRYVDQLIKLEAYDEAESRLKALPNQTLQNVNTKYYQLYRRMGDTDRALLHLRKELDLYPNRLDLIIPLMEIGSLGEEEIDRRLGQALVGRQGQIDTHFQMAKVHMRRQRLDLALESLISECELFPENQSALVQIKELLFTQPNRMKELGRERAGRLWGVLRAYVAVRTRGAPMPAAIPPLLSVLDQLKLVERDTRWLRRSLEWVPNSEWHDRAAHYAQRGAEAADETA